MFFERGTQSSTKHRRLRYYLLFALRFALLLLIVLAFANPFLRRPATDATGRLLLIVVDDSFSMRGRHPLRRRQAAGPRPAPSQTHAQQARIVSLGGQLGILTQPTADPDQLRTALDSITPPTAHASFGELGRGIRTLAESVLTPIDLHLFSDMQRTAMPANFADLGLPANVTLLLHP